MSEPAPSPAPVEVLPGAPSAPVVQPSGPAPEVVVIPNEKISGMGWGTIIIAIVVIGVAGFVIYKSLPKKGIE